MSDLTFGYMHNLYNDKQEIINDLFCQYIKPWLKYIYHSTMIQERKQNIDDAAHEKKLNKEVKLPSKKK